jgi:acyl-CoA thioesterase FadM
MTSHQQALPAALFRAEFRVSMGDTDAAQIIYFGAPPRWKEWLLTGWFKSIGHPLSEMLATGYSFPTVRLEVDYSAALRLDDAVEGSLHCGHIGTKSFSIIASFTAPAGGEAVRVRSWHVWTQMTSRADGDLQSAALPDWLRAGLAG